MSSERFKTEELLTGKGISYSLQYVNLNSVLKLVNHSVKKPLSNFTDEEDFILGVMLGYDRTRQCDRYIKRKGLDSKFIEKRRLVS